MTVLRYVPVVWAATPALETLEDHWVQSYPMEKLIGFSSLVSSAMEPQPAMPPVFTQMLRTIWAGLWILRGHIDKSLKSMLTLKKNNYNQCPLWTSGERTPCCKATVIVTSNPAQSQSRTHRYPSRNPGQFKGQRIFHFFSHYSRIVCLLNSSARIGGAFLTL